MNQHKFSAATTERAVELWGQRVAETLLSDGSAVVIVDDVLRIDDQAALDRLGVDHLDLLQIQRAKYLSSELVCYTSRIAFKAASSWSQFLTS